MIRENMKNRSSTVVGEKKSMIQWENHQFKM
jgi:hypothetical protein